jgi:hypothetical protein
MKTSVDLDTLRVTFSVYKVVAGELHYGYLDFDENALSRMAKAVRDEFTAEIMAGQKIEWRGIKDAGIENAPDSFHLDGAIFNIL